MDVMSAPTTIRFPAQLAQWAGHRAGGVRRLFDEASGRPGARVLQTNLLHRLESWARAFAAGEAGTPRMLLLVGGPGNGKTEAIESTVRWLDEELGAGGEVLAALRESFFPQAGEPVPRLVRVDTAHVARVSRHAAISIVQDASVASRGDRRTPAQLLAAELEEMLAAPDSEAYLCCVNRGILDDALFDAMDSGEGEARRLLEAVTRAVSLAPGAPPCWPLHGFPSVAVWPMDAESLLLAPTQGGEPPARIIFETALDPDGWPAEGVCEAGAACPFCASRGVLEREGARESIYRLLRWYEAGSAKRWSFRDLFSLVSYLLAGHREGAPGSDLTPCAWAARLAGLDEPARRGAAPGRESSTAIFRLVSAQYQHALFHRWDGKAGPAVLRWIKELGIQDDNTAMGLHWFLSSRRAPYLPATIGPLLEGMVDLLDPAVASPDAVVPATRRSSFAFRELDVRFSRSVDEGLGYIRRLQVLPRLEVDLLERLGRLDALLCTAALRRRRPAAASGLQRFIRDFACRLVRRTLGTRTATVPGRDILEEFQEIIQSEGDSLYDVAREVEKLLNHHQDFEISLTTTFGQPLPPAIRRATLVVPARRVRPLHDAASGRPRAPVPFLRVGDGQSAQPIAITYELFRAVKELERGMSPASLPRAVVALLDTTRARLSGPIVRDPEVLERAAIRIGAGGLTVEQGRRGFHARRGGR